MAVIRYPSEFAVTPASDYMQIDFIRKSYRSTNIEFERDSSLTDTLLLYMPQKISETIQQNWRHSTLGPDASKAMANQQNLFTEFPGTAIRRLIEESLMNNTVEQLGKIGAQNLSANSILSATSGIIYNPMMEVLYDGPAFRNFNFQFVLFTKSENDAKNIFKIVRNLQLASVPSSNGQTNLPNISSALGSSAIIGSVSAVAGGVSSAITNGLTPNKNSSPKQKVQTPTPTQAAIANILQTSVGGLLGSIGQGLGTGLAAGGLLFSGDDRFIKQPPLLQIRYRRGSKNHPYLLPLMPCAINNMTIDYTPSGNYTVLNNFGETEVATVVATTITLSLTETKTVFAKDYIDDFSKAGGVT